MRTTRLLGVLLGAATSYALVIAALEHEARACGGCFTPPPPPNEIESVITDERMLLAISMQQTTLYDQINYSGAPSSFAWVLPIKSQVTVGLSADILFDTIDTLTATQVVQPPTNCPPAPTCNTNAFTAPSAGYGADEAADAAVAVTVTAQAQVGPYETVQLHSTDGSALNAWLTSHGYSIPASVAPVIAAYVKDHFDFLALKLVPGVGVQAMQPVRVTSPGASPSLPLRMVAVGTGPTTGISIWVVADARWAPKNFPTFTVDSSELVWDWATSSSNYEKLRLAKEASYGGGGWQIESSLELNQYSIQSSIIQNVEYGPADAGGYTPPAADGGVADGSGGDGGGGDDDGGDGYGAQATAASEDIGVLFTGIAGPNVRITRMRSDVAHSALSADMILEASSDQAEMTNILNPEQQTGEPLCPVYNSSCSQVGEAPRSQALASAAGGGGSCNTRPSGEGSGSSGMGLTALACLAGAAALVRSRRARRAQS